MNAIFFKSLYIGLLVTLEVDTFLLITKQRPKLVKRSDETPLPSLIKTALNLEEEVEIYQVSKEIANFLEEDRLS